MGVRWLPFAVALALLAGCSDPAPAPAPAAMDPCVVSGPTDTSCDTVTAADPASVQHLHDYWGGQDRITVLDATQPSPVGYAGTAVPVARFRPEPGSVVPQGTASVAVTVSWTTQPDDLVGGFEVQVKTAGSDRFESLGMVEQGQTLDLETGHPDNDLPHQALSGWLVDILVHPDPLSGVAHYYGDTTVKLEANRGLDIPLYPGHPDRWEGRRDIELLRHEQDVAFFGDPRSTFRGCLGNETCLGALRPPQGAMVPDGAATVEVTLAWDTPEPAALGLAFHAADSDEFVEVLPSQSGPSSRTYSILVQRGMEDGPYTQQSLWEFVPYIAGPTSNGAFYGHLSLTATAVHG